MSQGYLLKNGYPRDILTYPKIPKKCYPIPDGRRAESESVRLSGSHVQVTEVAGRRSEVEGCLASADMAG
jgi:hypothetical protein